MISTQAIPEETVIHFSRPKVTRQAWVALLFVAAAAPILYGGLHASGGSRFLFLVLVIADVLFFGAGLLWFLKRLRVSTPALIINAEGICDNASALGARFVSWEEIASVQVGYFEPNRYLCLVLKDKEAFLRRQPVWKRTLMWVNSKMVGTPFVISVAALPMSLDLLKTEVEKHFLAS